MISLILGLHKKQQQENQARTENRMAVPRWGLSKMDVRVQKIQISSYKMKTSWECNV